MNRLLALLAALCVIAPLAAQVSIEQCYALAAQNYPQAKQLGLIERSRQYNLENAAKGWLPQVQLGAKASVQSDVTKLPFDLSALGITGIEIPSLSKDQYSVTVDVTQTVYDGGSIKASKSLTEAGADVESHQVNTALYALRERVNQLFFGILLYDEQLALNALLQEDLNLQAERIASYIEGGVAHESDLDAVRVEQLKAQQSATNYRAYRHAYVEMLGLLTGEDFDEATRFDRPTTGAKTSYSPIENNRPELALYDAQRRQLEAKDRYLDTQILPRFSLFAQGGYGKPGLNMLDDDFSLYGIIGARLTWNFSAFYTQKNDRSLINTNLEEVEAARATFLLNTQIDATRQSEETRRLQALLNTDDDIISLRKSIKSSSEVKMAGGTLSGTDLMRDINAEQQARLDKALHEMQLLLAIYELKYTVNQ